MLFSRERIIPNSFFSKGVGQQLLLKQRNQYLHLWAQIQHREPVFRACSYLAGRARGQCLPRFMVRVFSWAKEVERTHRAQACPAGRVIEGTSLLEAAGSLPLVQDKGTLSDIFLWVRILKSASGKMFEAWLGPSFLRMRNFVYVGIVFKFILKFPLFMFDDSENKRNFHYEKLDITSTSRSPKGQQFTPQICEKRSFINLSLYQIVFNEHILSTVMKHIDDCYSQCIYCTFTYFIISVC